LEKRKEEKRKEKRAQGKEKERRKHERTKGEEGKKREEGKKWEEERKKTLEAYKKLANTIPDKDKQITALQTLLEKSEQLNNSNKESNVRLQSEIAALKQSILQKEIENIAIKTTLSSLHKPPVAESKEPLIKNAAINAVKDALIAELSKKIAAQVSTPPVTTPPAPAMNIENDLKNAALTALYRALLSVPREHVDPSKKPTKFDVLITDKTYKYDEKGQPVEEKELTKYDSILAK
jgi:hypothetical protein